MGEQHWAHLEASWGNSGGALAFVEGDGVALVGGDALGKAARHTPTSTRIANVSK